MTSKPRPVLGMVFLVVFIDLVGFSVIFPLFPQMIDHYMAIEGETSLFGRLIRWLEDLAGSSTTAGFAVATLFGGILGSLYSLLQFLFAPVWGAISDRYGRRPTLLVTLTGTLVSYALWMVAGNFAVLIAARLLGGMMAGNISTASAVVGDTTEGRDRAKGMGILGMAIGLGFILGPAIGGLASLWKMAPVGEAVGSFGLNPFSAAALAAVLLSAFNLLWVALRFPETLPPEKRGRREHRPSLQPFKALRSIAVPGLTRTSWTYFTYFLAFSAMEFTLTFLAFERFSGPGDTDPWTERDNMWMFVFVGLLIALVQGGVVRRLVPRMGEKKLALAGLVLTLPGLLLVGLAGGVSTLYAGLAFMAVGSGLAMPTLSALVSRYAPSERQGLALGSFRSAGALSRAVGPILGGLLYWKLGSAAPYYAGTVFLLLPVLLAFGLPPVPDEPELAGRPAGDAA